MNCGMISAPRGGLSLGEEDASEGAGSTLLYERGERAAGLFVLRAIGDRETMRSSNQGTWLYVIIGIAGMLAQSGFGGLNSVPIIAILFLHFGQMKYSLSLTFAHLTLKDILHLGSRQVM
jgi:hypothetical protein